jgi:CheY-like chemotaxis protein
MAHRVLVVDDYEDAGEIACMLFGLLGHTCRWASTGREALALAVAFAPDLALVDLGLPDISGYEVARELRQQSSQPLYLAAVTGSSLAEDIARSFAAGFDEHVIKPIDERRIRMLLERADERQRDHPVQP